MVSFPIEWAKVKKNDYSFRARPDKNTKSRHRRIRDGTFSKLQKQY